MSNETPVKKTGATPIVEDLTAGGEVLGIWKVETILVRYRDGHGKDDVKLAVRLPNNEIYFFGREAIDLRPAQNWLKETVARRMKNA